MLAELVRPDCSHYMPRAGAIVMPASTEEVQAIVRAANKYKFGIKPHGTGWYHWASPMYDEGSRYGDEKDTVQLDMRRMNDIEIDEKNGIAIVGPYVIHAQLHAEAIKRGWSCNIIGAGSSCSVVAAACAYSGIGAGTMWMGGNAENVLGMEWVTLSGEIVRSGSLGSGDGWFCSEGPGPSVRGIMRGTLGSRGGMGVYTKCAVRLAHWPGRTDWPVYGHRPGLPPASGQDVPGLHRGRPRLGRLERPLLQDLRQRDRLHAASAVQPGRRRTRSRPSGSCTTTPPSS